MNFHFRLPWSKPDHSETAELRDRLIRAETRVVLLEDMVQHPRLRREPRKDKRSIQDKKAAVTASLERLFPWAHRTGRAE